MRFLILIMMLVFTLYSKSLFSNDKQSDASEYMGALKNLIIATQKTRGATFGYHKGNSSALLLIYKYRSDMKKAIGTMESLPLASEPIISARAISISQNLTKLNRVALKLKADEAFDQYTENIDQSLMLAQTVSKKGFNDLSEFGKMTSSIMLESILPLTENIGQLRAQGTGAAAQGHISNKNMYEMKALLNEVEKINSKFQADTSYIYQNNKEHYTTDLEAKLKNMQKSIDEFVSVTDKKIFQKKINMNPGKYFEMATDVITEIVIIFDINNKAIVSDSKGWI